MLIRYERLIVQLPVLFLQRLESFPPLPTSHLAVLGNIYGFDDTRNVEVKLRYFQVVLADPNSDEAQKFAAEAAHWVVGDDGSHQIKGRMKFCRYVRLRSLNIMKLADYYLGRHSS